MRKNKFRSITSLLLGLAFLTTLILPMAPAAFAAGDSDTIYIDTAEDLVQLAEQCTLDTWSQGKTVVLQSDISLAGVEFSTIPTFGGVFDGKNHTISDLEIAEGMSPSGLFGILQEKAVVKDLKISGSIAPSGEGSNAGGIAGENYGMIVGCIFTGDVQGKNNVGGIAGVNALTGQILNCSASGSVIGDKMTGGIAGCNLGTVGGCENDSYVNTVSEDPTIRTEDISIAFSLDLSQLSSMDTSTASSDTGGIAGYSSGILLDCVNNTPVGYPHIGYNVGGIVGRSCGYIHDCVNNADIFGRKDVSGIAGQMEPYIAQNLTEDTLDKLEDQLDELDAMITTVLDDANAGVGTVTSRLNKIANYMDSAAGAARNIKTTGSVTSTVKGGGEGDSAGSVTVTPPKAEASGSAENSGNASVTVSPGSGSAEGGSSASVDIQAGLTEGNVKGESGGSVSGNVSASTQIKVTTSLSGLSSAISGMAGQMRLLNGEISGTSGTMTDDIKAIQAQISAISDTAMKLYLGDGENDVLIDSSEIDIDLVTLGKVSKCLNNGSVSGDINVGGIAGSMAMEYELDPEDDVVANLDGAQRKKYEIKAIVYECVNNGNVTAKRNNVGGVCGRMDLGLIAQSEGYGNVSSESGDYVGGIAGLTSSTIRHSFAKCTLSGERHIGGIVGSGVEADFGGDSSTVAGCYSMVSIEASSEFSGAISGSDNGEFVENYFVSDTLAGINGRSYADRAEPISYARLLEICEEAEAAEEQEKLDAEDSDSKDENSEEEQTEEREENWTDEKTVSIPDAFRQLTLTFVADGQVLETVPFQYGDSFDKSIYPEIPEKDGYYAHWDKTELEELHFDTVVTAVYTPYVTALSNTDTRDDGRPIFFIEGQFNDEASAEITALPNTPQYFDTLPKSWIDFLAKSFTHTRISREIVEQWEVSIPDDGCEKHTIRYLAPGKDPDHLDIYVKQAAGWSRVDAELIGSYLTFSAEGQTVEIAAISTISVWWIWLIVAALLLLVLIPLVRRVRKRIKEKRLAAGKTNSGSGADGAEDTSSPSRAAPKAKKPWVMPLLIVLAVLLVIGGIAAALILPDVLSGVKAYDLLKKYGDQQELTMELTVDAELDGQDISFTALVDRTDVEGHRVTAIAQEEKALYYCDGVVFLENGNAYEMSDAFPDYSLLLSQAIELYRHVDIDEGDSTCSITAEGEDAKAILELLLPSAAGLLSDTNTLQLELVTEGEDVSEICFSGSGAFGDEAKTPFRLSATLKLDPPDQERIQIPESVREKVVSGEYEAVDTITGDLIRAANAWLTLNQADFLQAEISLKASCGPVALDDTLGFNRWNSEENQISAIQKHGYALYFTDTTICDKNGNVVLASDAPTVEAAKLLDIAYQACMNADMDCTEADGNYVYTLSLDESGMEAVAYAIAPETEGMDILFDSGSIHVVICHDEIQSITISCGGNVQVVLSSADVVLEAEVKFTGEGVETEIPEAVKTTLKK
ncbi:MAG: hypothetical protein ACI3VN_09820 [Candidatus Onthomonas sp.]